MPLSKHVAKKTMGYCEGCLCPGFPFCFDRKFPKSRICIETADEDKICLHCGCSSCPAKREKKWVSCRMCRDYFLSNLHCRCHSWFSMEHVPYFQPRFHHKIYDGEYEDDLIRECEVCEAQLFPYKEREPCDFEKHYASHEHFDEKNITRKSGASRLYFCHQCHEVKNFQCGFCLSKFSTASSAEQHILMKHKELMTCKTKCYICEMKPDWVKSGKRFGLQKWIRDRIKSMGKEIVNEEIGQEEELQTVLNECDDCNKPSYSDVVSQSS